MGTFKIHSAEFLASCATVEQILKESVPEIAIVGRSNVGKSSAINCLVNRQGLAKVGKTPGKTQTINFYEIRTSGPQFRLVDLPGYGFAKVPDHVQAQWGPLIEHYFQNRGVLEGVIQLVDSRRVQDSDREMAAWFRRLDIPTLLVATKADKISRGHRQATIRQFREVFLGGRDPIFLSAHTGEGRMEMLVQVRELLDPTV